MSCPFEHVADGVFVYHHNRAAGLCAVVLGQHGAVVVDAGGDPADGDVLAAFLRQHGHESMRLIYTHGHAGHVCGALSLGADEIFAHELTLDFLRELLPTWARRWQVCEEEAAVRIIWPTVTFNQEMRWHLGDRTIRSIRTPGHSIDGTSYLVEDVGVLIAGDAIVTGRVPGLDDGDGRTLEMSHRLLLEMGNVVKVLIPGHGPVVRGDEVIDGLSWGAAYIKGIRRRLRQQLAAGVESQEALLACCSYEEFVGDHFDRNHHDMPHRHEAAVTKMIAEERTRIP